MGRLLLRRSPRPRLGDDLAAEGHRNLGWPPGAACAVRNAPAGASLACCCVRFPQGANGVLSVSAAGRQSNVAAKRSARFRQELEVDTKCMGKRRRRPRQALTLACWWAASFFTIRWVSGAWGFATPLLEETEPLHRWGLPLGPVDEFAAQIAERGAQRDGTAADGMVAFRAALPCRNRRLRCVCSRASPGVFSRQSGPSDFLGGSRSKPNTSRNFASN